MSLKDEVKKQEKILISQFDQVYMSHIGFGNAILEAIIFEDHESLHAHNLDVGNAQSSLMGRWQAQCETIPTIASLSTFPIMKTKHISYHLASNYLIGQVRQKKKITRDDFSLWVEAQDLLTLSLLAFGRDLTNK